MGSRILARGWAEKEDLEGEWERVLGISFVWAQSNGKRKWKFLEFPALSTGK